MEAQVRSRPHGHGLVSALDRYWPIQVSAVRSFVVGLGEPTPVEPVVSGLD